MEASLEHLFSSAGIISLLTLTVLEIILGIDNVIFISIVSGKLPKELQDKARMLGIALALVARVGLLAILTVLTGEAFEEPIFSIGFLNMLDPEVRPGDISWKDLILFAGGLFLIGKSIAEIHDKLEGEEEGGHNVKRMTMLQAVIQIMLIDIVFSFDSILTAVGLARDLIIMIIAVVIGLAIMMAFSKAISAFVEKHPTVKMLALSFLVLIGFLLTLEAFGEHVPKGYVYFSMAFAVTVELLNMRLRKGTIKGKLTASNAKKAKKTQEAEVK